jgi:soluble cytochrome b562
VVDNLKEKIFDEDDRLPRVSDETGKRLDEHLEKAREEHDYCKAINHLYDSTDEVDKTGSEGKLSHNKANLLRP